MTRSAVPGPAVLDPPVSAPEPEAPLDLPPGRASSIPIRFLDSRQVRPRTGGSAERRLPTADGNADRG